MLCAGASARPQRRGIPSDRGTVADQALLPDERHDRSNAVQSTTDWGLGVANHPVDTARERSGGVANASGPAADFIILKRGASGALLVSIAGAGLGAIAHLIVARLIGQAEYGTYALMLSWVSVLAVVAQMGQDTSVVRFLPTYVLRAEWGTARGLHRAIGAWVFAISLLVACTGCLLVHWLGQSHTAAWRATFYIGFAMLPVLTQLQQSGALHRAFKRAVASNVYIVVVRPVALLALLGIAVLTGIKLDAPIATAVSAVAALLALVASAWHLARAWPAPGKSVTPTYRLRPWLVVGVQLSVLSMVIVAGSRLDVLLLGALVDPAQVGAYYAAVQIAGFALYGMQAVSVVLAPMIAERHDAGDLVGVQAVARRATRYSVLAAVASAVFFALAGRWVLGWFGPGFDSAYLPLLILLLGYCLTSAFGEVGFMMSMTKYQKQVSLFVLVGIAVNCVATLLLVPRLGATGAAIGAVLSLAVWRWLALRFVIRRIGINPSLVGRRRGTGGRA